MRLFVAFFLCALMACRQQSKVPDGVLPPAKMEAVLWDLIQADEVVNLIAANPQKNRYAIAVDRYQKAFSLHGTNKAQFQKSLDWYNTQPELMREVLDNIQKKHPVVTQPAPEVK